MFIKLTEHLKKQNIKFSIVEENITAVVFGLKTDVGSYQCIGDVKEDEHIFLFYTILGLTVPSDKLQLMAEMLTRINSGLMIGNFEMDFEDGELRYKTSIDYENELTDSLIHNIISVNIMTVDSFSKALMSLIVTNDSPQKILSEMV